MQLRKLIHRRIRKRGSGVDLAADVTAALAGNFGERSQTTHVSSRSRAVATSAGATRQREGADERRDRSPDHED
jgi:hypothetical protein